MKVNYLFVAISILLNLNSCSDVILDVDEDPIDVNNNSQENNGLVVYYDREENSVYKVGVQSLNREPIEENVPDFISDLSLSYDKERVAWIDIESEIYIYDINGNFIDKIIPNGSVSNIEWVNHSNHILVYDENGILKKWGNGNYTLPPYENFTSFEPPFVANQFARGTFTISKSNDIAIYHFNVNNSSVNQHILEVISENGEKIYTSINIIPSSFKFSNENNKYLSLFGDSFSTFGEISVVYKIENNIQQVNSFTSGYYNLILSYSEDEFIASSGISNILNGSRNLVYTNSSTSTSVITEFTNNTQNILFDWKL